MLLKNTTAGSNIESGLYDAIPPADVADMMRWAMKDPVVRAYTGKHAETRASDKADKAAKRKGIEAAAKDFGLVGQVMIKYAARAGTKDPEFMDKFGADVDQQRKYIKQV